MSDGVYIKSSVISKTVADAIKRNEYGILDFIKKSVLSDQRLRELIKREVAKAQQQQR